MAGPSNPVHAPAQGDAINQTTFTGAYLEWSYLEVDKRRELQQIQDLQCAACWPRPHTLHIDANMKLYVWDRQRQAWREPSHSGVLFQDSAECQEHMRDIDNALGNERVSKQPHMRSRMQCCPSQKPTVQMRNLP